MGDISKHFSRSEFACKCGCGFDTVDVELIENLQAIRSALGPVTITSGCRCFEYNKKVGGSANSQHLYGRAADIVVADLDAWSVQEFCEDELLPGGLGSYDSVTHVDSRTGHARWEG